MRRTNKLTGEYTEEKADMVMRLIHNLIDPRTHCLSDKCHSFGVHRSIPGCVYRSAVFNIHLNCNTSDKEAVEFLEKMEHHGRFFHCRIGGMILLHEHLAKKE
ncbi:MAG: hypothetical protein WCP24_00460 [bacterium]